MTYLKLSRYCDIDWVIFSYILFFLYIPIYVHLYVLIYKIYFQNIDIFNPALPFYSCFYIPTRKANIYLIVIYTLFMLYPLNLLLLGSTRAKFTWSLVNFSFLNDFLKNNNLNLNLIKFIF